MKKIAFLVLAHSDPTHLKRLVSLLSDQNDVYVHVDRKVDISSFLVNRKNITFIQQRSNVRWGGVSVINATLALIKEAVTRADATYSHLVLISGSCYPIKSIDDFQAYLWANEGSQLINMARTFNSEHYTRVMTGVWLFEKLPVRTFPGRLVRRGIHFLLHRFRRPFRFDFEPYYGSQWWAITPECAQYVLQFAARERGYLKYLSFSLAPDEHFFHTAIGNSAFVSPSNVNDYAVKTVPELANFHLIHPSLKYCWHRFFDYVEIENSDKYFVRKVSSALSSQLLELIDKRVHNGLHAGLREETATHARHEPALLRSVGVTTIVNWQADK